MRKRPQQEQPGSFARKDLKFVLYARKSTEEDTKQVHSTDDQISACKEYASAAGDINIVDVVEERKSAKYSHNRPKFTQMIQDVKNGKFDAIIAYAPDRLSRNMLEAGEIIDMLTPTKERGSILLKDLVFPSATFGNDPGGRLSLAVMFSLATQYSEQLSERVALGHQKNLKRGISSGTPKWGYTRDEFSGHYVPSSIFDAIKECWKMMLDGKSQADVLRWLVKNKIRRQTKSGKLIKPTKQILNSIFDDKIYAGILEQGGEVVNLCEAQPDFVPMVTEAEFEKVQEMRSGRYQAHIKHKDGSCIELPLKGMVFCDVCGSKMYPGASKGRLPGKKFVYYTCQNKDCSRKPKGVRAKYIFDDFYNTLKAMELDSEAAYAAYEKELDENIKLELDALKKERTSLVGLKNQHKRDLDLANADFTRLSDPKLKTPEITLEACRARIDVAETAMNDITDDIAKIDKTMNDPNSIKMTKEDFLNLLATSAEKLKNGTFAEKDAIARIWLLNLRIGEQKEVSYLCKTELKDLVKFGKVISGGSGRT